MMRRIILALLLACSPGVLPAHAACDGSTSLGTHLKVASAKVRATKTLTIIALGSSSTSGTGASSDASTYPAVLEASLQAALPSVKVQVVNRGRPGLNSQQMMDRFERDLGGAGADIIIWQTGVNDLLGARDMHVERDTIMHGMKMLGRYGADIILMDAQYAPRVLGEANHGPMQKVIHDAARKHHAGLYRRFDLMQTWVRADAGGMTAYVGWDGLHLTDKGYACVGRSLAAAILRSMPR